ncbi:MAG TPA: YidC/Oxa1 family insertase periplasmic-domain containing protein, partial [Gemmatimonadaceae bacterium]
MNRRFVLAIILTALVIVGTPLIFPPGPRTGTRADSVAAAARIPTESTPRTEPASTPARSATPTASAQPSRALSDVHDTITVRTRLTHYRFSALGAAPVSADLDSYPSRRPGKKGLATNLITPQGRLVGYRLAIGADTVLLDTVRFSRLNAPPSEIDYAASVLGRTVRISYRLPKSADEEYRLQVAARVDSVPAGASLLVALPTTIESNEPDTLDDMNHLGVSLRPIRGDVSSMNFSKLDPGEMRTETGPFTWAAVRDKYFLVVARTNAVPFATARIQGLARTGKVASHVLTEATLPLKNGAASFEIYAGPQDFERLQRLGGDLDQVNPYAGWFHGVVQPVAALVMKALLWMKRTTRLNYGWVLVLFGV